MREKERTTERGKEVKIEREREREREGEIKRE